MSNQNPPVAVVMGSDSDWEVMQRCAGQLEAFGIACEVRILSAHRSPAAVEEFASGAAQRGIKVIIAAAGMNAALGGCIAARTALPVIGVAMASGPLAGVDALLATVQMPPGIPVGCVGIGAAGATNAAVFAAEILAAGDPSIAGKLAAYKAELTARTLAKDKELQEKRR